AVDIGAYPLTIAVTDSGNGAPSQKLSASEQITFTVRTANFSPTLQPIVSLSSTEGQKLTVQLQARDLDGDPLTYSASNLPAGAIFNRATGNFEWTPSFIQAGAYDINFSASDGAATSLQAAHIVVANFDRPPQLIWLHPQVVRENDLLNFDIVAGDIDGDTVTYRASDLPAGAFFDTASGQFRWTPSYEQAGHYIIHFDAFDPDKKSDSMDVVVDAANVNRLPQIHTSDHQAALGKPLSFFINASDPDADTILTYTAVHLPQGATLNSQTGRFDWTPSPAQAGEYVVDFSVSDDHDIASQSVVLHAALSPTPPSIVLSLTPSFPVIPGQKVLVHVIA